MHSKSSCKRGDGHVFSPSPLEGEGAGGREVLRRTILLLTLLAALWSGSATASAHALLLRSSPAADAILQTTPSQIHLWFSEDLNGSASRIVVWDRNRHVVNEGNADRVPGQPRQLVVNLKPLPAGSYLVLWTSVSAEDGHLLRGAFSFSVKHRGPLPSVTGISLGQTQTFPDTPTLAAILAHWIELLAATLWVGAAAFSTLIFPKAARRLGDPQVDAERRLARRWLAGSILALVASSLAVLTLDAYSLAGSDWGGVLTRSNLSSLFAGQYAQLWTGRQALALLGLGLVLRMPRHPHQSGNDGSGVGPLLAVGLVYLYAFAASGHAASAHIGVVSGSHILSASIFLDWLHFLANALWFGGQMYIVLVLTPSLRILEDKTCMTSRTFLATLNRFSPFAIASILFFSLTGGFNGTIHIPSWYAFFYSVYGRALIVKMTLIGLMLLVGANHVLRLRPRLGRELERAPAVALAASVELASDPLESTTLGRMKRLLGWLRVEPFLGIGVLFAVSIMFYYPVPAGFSPAGPSSYTAQAGGLGARLSITPDRAGPNQVTVSLRDAQGRPVQQATVVVLTNHLDMVMGQGKAPLTKIASGTFRGTTELGMGGHWRLDLLVFRPPGILTRMSVKVLVGT